MQRRSLLLAGCALPVVIAGRALAAREPVIGGPCEGCDWVFDDLPSTLGSRARIAPPSEPGTPLVIEGVVRNARGAVAPGIVVYAYHTDDQGLYPPAANRHGRLRGWARTDTAGRYRFDTIRPRAYPSRDVPEHVHMHVIEPQRATYYIDDLHFDDDPLLTAAHRRSSGRGGPGIARPERRDGTWLVRRDIILGHDIPAYG